MSRSTGAVRPDGRTFDLNPGHIHYNPTANTAQMYKGGNASLDASWEYVDLSASDTNENEGDIFANRGSLVNRTSELLVLNATSTAVPWQGSVYNTDTIWVVGTPTRLTVPAGVTRVSLVGNANFDVNATGLRGVWFRKNGNDFVGGGNTRAAPNAAQQIILNVSSAVLVVIAGDYFELFVYQTSGVSLNVFGTGPDTNTFASMKIVS